MVSAFEMFPTGCSGCTLYHCTVVVLFQIELTLSSVIAFLMPTLVMPSRFSVVNCVSQFSSSILDMRYLGEVDVSDKDRNGDSLFISAARNGEFGYAVSGRGVAWWSRIWTGGPMGYVGHLFIECIVSGCKTKGDF